MPDPNSDANSPPIVPTTATAIVSFTDNPNTGGERVFNAIQIVVDP